MKPANHVNSSTTKDTNSDSGFFTYNQNHAKQYSLLDWGSQSMASLNDSLAEIDPTNKKDFLALVGQSDGTLASQSYTSHHGFVRKKTLGSSSRLLGKNLRRSKFSVNTSGKISGASMFSLQLLNKSTNDNMHKSFANASTKFTMVQMDQAEQKALGKKLEAKLESIANRIKNTAKREPTEDTTVQVNGVKIKRKVIQPRLHHGEERQKLVSSFRDYSLLIAKGSNYDQPGPSTKPCQDCISTASSDDLECVVICDGHGKGGHEVAWQVANFISAQLLLRVKDELASLDSNKLDKAGLFAASTKASIFEEVFQKCDDEVIWSSELRSWTWCKITGGKYEGLLGHITLEVDDKETHRIPAGEPDQELPVKVFPSAPRNWADKSINREEEIAVLDVMIERKHLKCDRPFYGGSTCVAFVREKSLNHCRAATSGDSRVMYIPKTRGKVAKTDGSAMERIVGKPTGLGMDRLKASLGIIRKPVASITVEHNIHVKAELARIQRDFPGKFVLGGRATAGVHGYLYSNAVFPWTGGITPTRGFGDRLYFGAGVISKPQVSEVMMLEEGDCVMGGSDGIFDDSVWGKNLSQLLYFVNQHNGHGLKSQDVAELVYQETEHRCHEWGHFRTDDISMFMLNIGKPTNSNVV